MELPRLAAKQKRYLDLLRFATTEHLDPTTKSNLLKTLKMYHDALASCCIAPKGSPDDALVLASLERELNTLHNDARLRSAAP